MLTDKTFTTSKGFKFTRTETGWLDETSGLEWEFEYKTNINQYEAEKCAKEKGKRLPTQAEFLEAEEHGIRELPNMQWQGLWFWSSTPYRDYADYAYVFNGYNGYANVSYYRTVTYHNVAARLISKVSDNNILISDKDKLAKVRELLQQALELLKC